MPRTSGFAASRFSASRFSPSRLQRTLLAAFAAGSAALAAVGLAARPAASATSSTASRTGTLVTISSSGGFVPMGFDFRNSARNIVNLDGRQFRPGAITMQYPGPALYPLWQNTFLPREIATIDALARAAGLHKKTVDWGVPGTADVPNLTVNYRGTRHSIASFGVGEEGLSAHQRKARRSVAALLAYLDRKPGTAVVPRSVVMIATPVDASTPLPGSEGVAVATVDWPANSVPLATAATCLTVTGAEGLATAAFLAKQNELTRYRSGGVLYQVFARTHVHGDWGCGPQ